MSKYVRVNKRKYHFIYKTTNLLSGKYYIGMHSTDDLNDGYLGSGSRLRYSIRKYGKENHKREILEFCDSRETLIERETEIVNLNEIAKEECLNLCVGGTGGSQSPEIQRRWINAGKAAFTKKLKEDINFKNDFCQKISNSMKKLWTNDNYRNQHLDRLANNFKGKKHTEETKEKLRNITLELCKDEKFRMTRANYGEKNGMYGSARFGSLNPMWGKKHSEEAKEKQRIKRKEWFKNNESPSKGKPCLESIKKALSEKNSKEYELISPEGNIVKIKNLTKFAKENNLNIGCLYHVVFGRNKSHKGWKNAT